MVQMKGVRARLIDPRDVSEQDNCPTYRVYFWTADASHCYEYQIQGAPDVGAVLTWVRTTGGGLIPVIYAETDAPNGGRRLLRLQGTEPGQG